MSTPLQCSVARMAEALNGQPMATTPQKAHTISPVYVGSAPSSSSGNGWNSALQTLLQAAKMEPCSSQYLEEVIKDSMYS